MLVDVHGDEELPYCFVAGSEGVPGWGERLELLQVCAPGARSRGGLGLDAWLHAGCVRVHVCLQTASTHTHAWPGAGSCMQLRSLPLQVTRRLRHLPRHALPCCPAATAPTQRSFKAAFQRASPDFQVTHGYAIDQPNQANMSICSNQVSPAAVRVRA